jgi:hypothetical protein
MSDEIKITGVDEITAAMSDLVSHVQDDLDEQLGDHATAEQAKVRARGRSVGGVARLASKSVDARKTKHGGQIVAGGGHKLPDGTGTCGDIFPGSEWGGGSRPATKQFRAYRSQGYWFFNQAIADEQQLDEQLLDSITDRLED